MTHITHSISDVLKLFSLTLYHICEQLGFCDMVEPTVAIHLCNASLLRGLYQLRSLNLDKPKVYRTEVPMIPQTATYTALFAYTSL